MDYNMIMLRIEEEGVLEGQPSVKNAHSATHLCVWRNEAVMVCMEQAIYVYSLPKMAQRTASLSAILSLSQIFSAFSKQLYQDFLTSIFRSQKQDFSAQLFKSGDTRTNALLNIDAIRDRIVFFNNAAFTVADFQVGPHGQLLILLADGRAALIPDWRNPSQATNLNEIAKEKIMQACFVEQGLSMLTGTKIICINDLSDRTKIVTYKHIVQIASSLYGRMRLRDRLQLYVVSPREVQVVELKKKAVSTKSIKFEEFVTQTFHYGKTLFVATLKSLYSVDLDTLSTDQVAEFSTPTELLYVDKFGSYVQRSNNNSKEVLWLLDSTSNGVFVGQTIRRGGNYKEGRLLLFQPNLHYFTRRLAGNIREGDSFIDVKDAVFVNTTAQNKAVLQEIINLSKSGLLVWEGMQLSNEQYNALCINITHAFQGKELVKQKIIDRALKLRFHDRPSNTKHDLRCCFTGKELGEELLSHCQKCDLFGAYSEGRRCVVCFSQMVRYE